MVVVTIATMDQDLEHRVPLVVVAAQKTKKLTPLALVKLGRAMMAAKVVMVETMHMVVLAVEPVVQVLPLGATTSPMEGLGSLLTFLVSQHTMAVVGEVEHGIAMPVVEVQGAAGAPLRGLLGMWSQEQMAQTDKEAAAEGAQEVEAWADLVAQAS